MADRTSGSRAVRQGYLAAFGISLLLSRAGNRRRILRLLPQVPRFLENVWSRLAGRSAEEAILQERAADHPGHRSDSVSAVNALRRRVGDGQRKRARDDREEPQELSRNPPVRQVA